MQLILEGTFFLTLVISCSLAAKIKRESETIANSFAAPKEDQNTIIDDVLAKTDNGRLKMVFDNTGKVEFEMKDKTTLKNLCDDETFQYLISCKNNAKHKKDVNATINSGLFKPKKIKKDKEDEIYERQKRSTTYVNPCEKNEELYTMMTVTECETGIMYEVLFDPWTGHYQQFYINMCKDNPPTLFINSAVIYSCQEQVQRYLAAGYNSQLPNPPLEIFHACFQSKCGYHREI